MRKPVVLLAIAALVSGVTAVPVGCGSPAPADQPIAAPAETPRPLLKPTGTESTPLVDDSVSTPTPVSSAGEPIELVPVDSSVTSKKQEPIGVVDLDSPRKGGPGATGPVRG